MILSRGPPTSWALAMAAALFFWASLAAAQLISVDYCSNVNTGTTPANYSDFQSQGLCQVFCRDRKFGLAIVKQNNCWCSSILPANEIQVSTDKCKKSCPGFPPDFCGGDRTFGYMRINANPLTATAASGAEETSGRRPQTTQHPGRVTVTTSPSSSSTSEDTTSTGSSTRRTTQLIETVTIDGVIKTVTAPANPDNTDPSEANRPDGGGGGGLGGGAIAGIVVGILAVLAVGGIAGFLVMRRRKAKAEEEYEGSESPRGSGAAMAHVPRSPDGGDGFGGRPGGRRPTNATYGSDHSSGRRSSMLMPGDPRMNPSTGIYGRTDLNKSHDSFLSMQDNRDYSRPVHEPAKVLKVTNASPDDID